MLQKGFIKNHGHRYPEEDRLGLLIHRIILYAGVCIILAGLLFMLMNINSADSMIEIWLAFMIAGVVVVFLSLLIRLNREWHR